MAGAMRRQRGAPDIWPGFVDAISALLIIVIFLLMVFTLAQYFLSDILSGRDAALERLNQRVSALAQMLSMEQTANEDLRAALARASARLEAVVAERDALGRSLAETEARAAAADAELAEAYRTIEADRERVELQLRRLASLERDVQALRALRAELEKRIAEQAAALEGRDEEIGALRDRSKELAAELAAERERTLLAQKEIDDRDVRLRALAGRAVASKEALSAEQALSREAREQVELLNAQLAALRDQLARISAALEASEARAEEQNVEIANLSKRLNEALLDKVQELASFRSEFFGRLRKALGDRRDIRVVGDRFVFESEILFQPGETSLQPAGRAQIEQLANTLLDISRNIPEDLDWVLRVDGHTDVLPISTPVYPSNWELSTARAVAVVKFLVELGVPPGRLAATGFGEFQPLDPANTLEAFRRNRRIEFKLTQR